MLRRSRVIDVDKENVEVETGNGNGNIKGKGIAKLELGPSNSNVLGVKSTNTLRWSQSTLNGIKKIPTLRRTISSIPYLPPPGSKSAIRTSTNPLSSRTSKIPKIPKAPNVFLRGGDGPLLRRRSLEIESDDELEVTFDVDQQMGCGVMAERMGLLNTNEEIILTNTHTKSHVDDIETKTVLDQPILDDYETKPLGLETVWSQTNSKNNQDISDPLNLELELNLQSPTPVNLNVDKNDVDLEFDLEFSDAENEDERLQNIIKFYS